MQVSQSDSLMAILYHLQRGKFPLDPQATAFQIKEKSTLLFSSWLYKNNFIQEISWIKLKYKGADQMIKGIEKLSKEQKDLMEKTNKLHTEIVGLDYKEGMEIIETWIDENNTVCVRLKNGEWYHYTKDGTWY